MGGGAAANPQPHLPHLGWRLATSARPPRGPVWLVVPGVPAPALRLRVSSRGRPGTRGTAVLCFCPGGGRREPRWQEQGRVLSCPFVIVTAECLAMPPMPQRDAWQDTPSQRPTQVPLPLTVINSLGQPFPKGALPDTGLQDASGRKRVLWSNNLGECCALCPHAGRSQGPLLS